MLSSTYVCGLWFNLMSANIKESQCSKLSFVLYFKTSIGRVKYRQKLGTWCFLYFSCGLRWFAMSQYPCGNANCVGLCVTSLSFTGYCLHYCIQYEAKLYKIIVLVPDVPGAEDRTIGKWWTVSWWDQCWCFAKVCPVSRLGSDFMSKIYVFL